MIARKSHIINYNNLRSTSKTKWKLCKADRVTQDRYKHLKFVEMDERTERGITILNIGV